MKKISSNLKYTNTIFKKTLEKQSYFMTKGSSKFFDLHEYQSKIMLRKYQLRVQNGDVATTSEEAFNIANNLKGDLILKAQVQAGGRGKGHLTSGLKGGVKICKNSQQIFDLSKQMLGYNLITHQTTKEGLPVNSVLVLESVDIKEQIYCAFLLDRTHQKPVLIVSNEGGVDIEDVAANRPEAIHVFPIEINTGLTNEILDKVANLIKFESDAQRKEAKDQLVKMYDMFNKLDATQIEINPWAIDTKGDLYLVDAKINIDESAFFRQKEIIDMKENSKASEDVDLNEKKANAAGLNYIGLKGNIGCLVNGAGLAMATMDIITLKDGEPANFLDVGGGATAEQVTEAFQILVNHPNVKTILVNIFGGIMRCDVIAQGIIKAAENVGINIPVIVRLTGTNAKEGMKMLTDYAANSNGKTKFVTAKDLDSAADEAVKQITKLKI
jgi:succinyl-CoA synthetase beta subunit